MAGRDLLRASDTTSQWPTRKGATTDCFIDRNPAKPIRGRGGHRFFGSAFNVLLDVWGARSFEAPGTTVVHRESIATLNRVLPMALYTDRYHFASLSRLSPAVWVAASSRPKVIGSLRPDRWQPPPDRRSLAASSRPKVIGSLR